MNETIRNATLDDVEEIMNIFVLAKQFMRASGNMNQWSGNYPEKSLVEADIANKNCYVVECENKLLGVFSMFSSPDKTYNKIYNGKWLNDEPYLVIHRIAITEHGKGLAAKCFDFALSRCDNLRIDTHRDNKPMRTALEKNGFTECGIIYLESGDERLAFHKIKG